MNIRYGLLLPAMLAVLLLVGSASARCPSIPDPPYTPKDPAENIVTVTASVEQPSAAPSAAGGGVAIDGHVLHLIIVFAAPTPPAGQQINIIVTELQGSTETGIDCTSSAGPAKTTYTFDIPLTTDGGAAQIAVYAWLGPVPGTDRAPNGGFYIADRMVRQFDDPEGAVGGVVMPTNKLEIVAPFAALAGLVVAVSAVVVVKRRRD